MEIWWKVNSGFDMLTLWTFLVDVLHVAQQRDSLFGACGKQCALGTDLDNLADDRGPEKLIGLSTGHTRVQQGSRDITRMTTGFGPPVSHQEIGSAWKRTLKHDTCLGRDASVLPIKTITDFFRKMKWRNGCWLHPGVKERNLGHCVGVCLHGKKSSQWLPFHLEDLSLILNVDAFMINVCYQHALENKLSDSNQEICNEIVWVFKHGPLTSS